jgi:hypothetical protein
MQTIQVALARIRPRPTRRTLGPLIFYPQTSSISVTRAFRTRLEAQRRAPRSFLAEPAVVAKAAFYGPFVWLTHTRPRPTVKTLGEPQVVRVPSVEQKLRTLAISLVRTRPRPTIHVLGEPTVVSTPPVETVVAVTLTHARPKPTSKTLGEPQTLRVFAGPSVHTVATRPRPTSRFLRIPTKVRVPSVEQAEQTIRVTLARIRPRPTSKVLGEPTVLQVFFGPLVRLVRIRPRPTVVRKIVQGAYRLPDRSQSTIRVVLNGRIQREAVRRGPHTRIFPPTTLAARRIAILVLTVVLVAVKDALRRNRRQPKYRIVPPTAVRAQNLYFKAGLPESGWATGRLTCVGADYTVCPPESGWATGRMSVDIQTDDTDQDWSAGKPL